MQYSLQRFSGKGTTKVIVEIGYADALIKLHFLVESFVESFLESSVTADTIVWPDFVKLSRKNELWKSTCFELFSGRPDEANYLEVNLGPSGAWNCYSFTSYRTGMQESDAIAPVSMLSDPMSKTLEVTLRCMPPFESGKYALGISAVIELAPGDTEFHALAHGAKPDFHDREHHALIDLDVR